MQHLIQVSPAIEAGLLQELANTPVKALDHAVCLWMTWWRQSVFYAHAGTDLLEHMLAAGRRKNSYKTQELASKSHFAK